MVTYHLRAWAGDAGYLFFHQTEPMSPKMKHFVVQGRTARIVVWAYECDDLDAQQAFAVAVAFMTGKSKPLFRDGQVVWGEMDVD